MKPGIISAIFDEAHATLRNNDNGVYIKPGPGQYPGQWNWDAALAVIGLASIDPERARNEVESLLTGQWEDGMVPHIVFHDPVVDYFPGPAIWGSAQGSSPIPSSGITQPPLLATAVRILHEVAPSIAFLEQVVPDLDRWHRWFHHWRRFDRHGLVAILHPWESGTDNSPRFDRALREINGSESPMVRRDLHHVSAEQRPSDSDYRAYLRILEHLRDAGYRPELDESIFAIGDTFLTAVLAVAERDVGYLLSELGQASTEAAAREASLRAALENAWDARRARFVDQDLGGSDEWFDTITGILPLYALPRHPGSGVLAEAIADPASFGPSPEYPRMPTSVSKASPAFEPRRYWRGPVWVNINWFLIRAFQAAGYPDLASHLREHTLDLVGTQGFWEYYDPRNGQGLGCGQFTWSAAVAIDLINRP